MATNRAEGFEGKVAFVTGGSSGIGRATAIAFAREGADVVVADVLAEGGAETVRLVRESGRKGVFVKCDVSREADVRAALSAAVEACGRVDFAFNNAGTEGSQAPTAECTDDNWDRVAQRRTWGLGAVIAA